MKSFVQYGAGNIGRGFLGPLFSAAGYHVSFIDVNQTLVAALNQRRSYPLEIVSDQKTSVTLVENVSGIDGTDTDAVAHAIAKASVMATAVGVNVIPHIAKTLAQGLSVRWQKGNVAPLNIIICENMLNADQYLRKLLFSYLSPAEAEVFDQRVGLVEASIGRMVPVMTEEMKQKDALCIRVEPYAFLPVDKAAFRGEIPAVPGLSPYSPFAFYLQRKLFLHNMGHALTAYLGHLLNQTYIWQAINTPVVKLLVQRAMLESARALSRRFSVPLEEILPHIDDLLLRFANKALGDTIDRVGRDTKRKLSPDDRFAGAIKLAEEVGVSPIYLSAGLACGLLFTGQNDEGSAYVKTMLAEHGAAYVLAHHCDISPESNTMDMALSAYGLLSKGGTPEELLALCETLLREQLAGSPVI
ncbi:MAG TPA: mannitol dehydrogenase [Clostridiales bacterium]|nr:mannitol dehydrogenase [Clostridiales bacterium]